MMVRFIAASVALIGHAMCMQAEQPVSFLDLETGTHEEPVAWRHMLVLTDPVEDTDDEAAVSHLINYAATADNVFKHIICVSGDVASTVRVQRLLSLGLPQRGPRHQIITIEEFLASAEAGADYRGTPEAPALILQIAPLYPIRSYRLAENGFAIKDGGKPVLLEGFTAGQIAHDSQILAARIADAVGVFDYVLLGDLGRTKNSQNEFRLAAVLFEAGASNSWVINSARVGSFTPATVGSFGPQLAQEINEYFFKFSHGMAAPLLFIVHLLGAPSGPKFIGTRTYFDIKYPSGSFDRLDIRAVATWSTGQRLSFYDFAERVFLARLINATPLGIPDVWHHMEAPEGWDEMWAAAAAEIDARIAALEQAVTATEAVAEEDSISRKLVRSETVSIAEARHDKQTYQAEEIAQLRKRLDGMISEKKNWELLWAKRAALGQTPQDQVEGVARMLAAQFLLTRPGSSQLDPLYSGAAAQQSYPEDAVVQIYQSMELEIVEGQVFHRPSRTALPELTEKLPEFMDNMARAAVDPLVQDSPMSSAYDLAAAVYAAKVCRRNADVLLGKALQPSGLYVQIDFDGTAEALADIARTTASV